MKWEYVGSTFIFAAIGYLIGSISMSIIVSKIIKKEDIRTIGSGNAGATNTLRSYGPGLGFLVFIFDILKVFIIVVISWVIKIYSNIEWLSGMVIQMVGLAAVIGHIWPIYFKFKGGKGAACTVGFLLSMQWILVIIGIILFLIIVIKTKKASIGSMSVIFLIILLQIGFSFIPVLNDSWSLPFMNVLPWWVNTIFLTIIWILVMIKHIPNIKRLISGQENSTGSK